MTILVAGDRVTVHPTAVKGVRPWRGKVVSVEEARPSYVLVLPTESQRGYAAVALEVPAHIVRRGGE